jgi:hypothetical protein
MRTFIQISGTLALALVSIPRLRAEDRFLTLLFGPNSPQTARQGARAVAAAARRWLNTPGSAVAVRSAGSLESQNLDSRMDPTRIAQILAESASAARDSDPATFLTSIDNAAQSTALHPGSRVLVAIANSPPLSSEAERALIHLIEYCRANAIRVIVLDIGETPQDESAMNRFARDTGGRFIREAKALEGSVAAALAVEPPAVAQQPGPAPQAPASGKTPFQIAVNTRFIRTSMKESLSVGSIGHLTDADSGEAVIPLVERAYDATESRAPLRGLLLVESPLGALKFDTDPNSGLYTARARMVAIVRNSAGRPVWTAQKDVNIRGPVRKLAARQKGSLLFMRGLTLPGGDTYTLEATIDDLLGAATGSVSKPLRTGVSAPGLRASDALLVRPFSGSADRFEADQVLNYEGDALSFMLDPVFRAGEPVNLQMYVVLYPDVGGASPDLGLEIIRDGRVVSRIPVKFTRPLRDVALEGKFGTLAGKGSMIYGGQPREFPYLASIKSPTLLPGNYAAVLSIGKAATSSPGPPISALLETASREPPPSAPHPTNQTWMCRRLKPPPSTQAAPPWTQTKGRGYGTRRRRTLPATRPASRTSGAFRRRTASPHRCARPSS